MSTIHPKLNWRQFQIDRAKKRKKRLLIWWLIGAFSSIAVFAVLCLFSPAAHETPIPTSIPAAIEQRTNLPINNSRIPQGITVKPRKDLLNEENHNPVERIATSKDVYGSIRNSIYDNPILLDLKTVKFNEGTAHELNQLHKMELISATASTIESTPVVAQRITVINSTYIPWTSERFISDEFSNYRPLNSIEIQMSIPISDDSNKLNIDFVPAFSQQRFQLQYFDSYADKKYLPGSIVGYTRNIDSILPVYRDTVFGITSRTLRKNGIVQEITFPVRFSSRVYDLHKIYTDAFIHSGILMRVSTDGLWSDSGEIYSIENSNRIGFQMKGGINVGYHIDSFTLEVGYKFVWQSNVMQNMRSIYHYPNIGIQLEL